MVLALLLVIASRLFCFALDLQLLFVILGKNGHEIVRDTALESEILRELLEVVQFDILLVTSVGSLGLLRCAQSKLFVVSKLLESISRATQMILGRLLGLRA